MPCLYFCDEWICWGGRFVLRLGVFGGGDGFEAVGFVAGGDGAVAGADYGEAFGDSPCGGRATNCRRRRRR